MKSRLHITPYPKSLGYDLHGGLATLFRAYLKTHGNVQIAVDLALLELAARDAILPDMPTVIEDGWLNSSPHATVEMPTVIEEIPTIILEDPEETMESALSALKHLARGGKIE